MLPVGMPSVQSTSVTAAPLSEAVADSCVASQSWGHRGRRRALLHLLVAVIYLVVVARTMGLEPLPLVVAVALCLRGILPGSLNRIAALATPFAAFAAFYHSLGYLKGRVTANGVHVFWPYWFDKVAFGVGDLGSRWSCNEVFAIHHCPAADFVTGVAYLSFLPCVILFATYLVLHDRSEAGLSRARRFCWTFFAVNVAGFGTYIFFPVAPPWYVAQRGFGAVDPLAKASAAALARWDRLVGIPYFENFYAQATEVYGAMPSMHCAYPMILLLFARELKRPRLFIALVAYELLMCFSAVYLQHHYVTDVIAGIAYASIIYAIGRGPLSKALGAVARFPTAEQ